MAAYIAMRVKAKRDGTPDKPGSVEAAQAYYKQFFAISIYQPFQEDTNAILVGDGYEDCIPVA